MRRLPSISPLRAPLQWRVYPGLRVGAFYKQVHEATKRGCVCVFHAFMFFFLAVSVTPNHP